MGRLEDVSALEVSLVGKPANNRKFLLFKSEKGGGKMGEDFIEKQMEDMDLNPDLSSDAEGAVVGAIKMLNDYFEELPESFTNQLLGLVGGAEMAEQFLGEREDEDVEEMMMEMPKEVQKQVETLFKSHKQLLKEKQEIMKELKEAKEKEKEKEYIAKAKEFDNLPIKAEEFGLVLKSIASNSEDDYKAVEELLKSVDEIAKTSGIFKELGSSSEGESGANAWSRIEKSADSLVKEEGLTKEKAITKVLSDNPDLYQEYLSENN